MSKSGFLSSWKNDLFRSLSPRPINQSALDQSFLQVIVTVVIIIIIIYKIPLLIVLGRFYRKAANYFFRILRSLASLGGRSQLTDHWNNFI